MPPRPQQELLLGLPGIFITIADINKFYQNSNLFCLHLLAKLLTILVKILSENKGEKEEKVLASPPPTNHLVTPGLDLTTAPNSLLITCLLRHHWMTGTRRGRTILRQLDLSDFTVLGKEA